MNRLITKEEVRRKVDSLWAKNLYNEAAAMQELIDWLKEPDNDHLDAIIPVTKESAVGWFNAGHPILMSISGTRINVVRAVMKESKADKRTLDEMLEKFCSVEHVDKSRVLFSVRYNKLTTAEEKRAFKLNFMPEYE